ncbi:hypothetical protein R5R35_006288 [Gryllus longicercus]|uniref:D-beta-hydroxybutyrate dehydrogenase, mitochondrial n=1 Tax=Gryllus longicercus TaxID=2509291 RepID=A0AAN9W999_9ORTH
MVNSARLDTAYRAATLGAQAAVAAAALGALAGAGVGACALTAFCAGVALGLALDALRLPPAGRAVLVTGCDSGFGLAVALRLQELGCIVFAGCLQAADSAGALRLRKLPRVHVLQLDITDDQQVAAARRVVEKQQPLEGLWGVVNNAGWTTVGHVEWVPVATCQRMQEINVWGMVRVLQAFLPLLRRAAGGGARVVNVASALGRQGAINKSAYCVSKYGVEALSDCLRYEMRQFGIHVAIIEPGNFVNATKCYTEASIRRIAADLWEHMAEEVREEYGRAYFDAVFQRKIDYSTRGTDDPSPVVEAITQALFHRFPHPRYQPMEPYFKIRTWLATHGPEWLYELIRP